MESPRGRLAATYSGAMLFSPMLSTSKSSNVAAAVAAVGLTAWHFIALHRLFPADDATGIRPRIAAGWLVSALRRARKWKRVPAATPGENG